VYTIKNIFTCKTAPKRTQHFDYDTWSQMHYGDLRERESKSRAFYQSAVEKRESRREERMRSFMFCALLVSVMCYLHLAMDGEGPRRPPPAQPPAGKPPS